MSTPGCSTHPHCTRCVERAVIRIGAALLALLAPPAVVAAQDAQEAFFEQRVRPLLVRRCYPCHSGPKSGGGLSLETANGWRTGGDSGPAIVPGHPEQSLVIEAINYRSLQMPPADEGGRLPADEIEVLTKWVAMGAPDPRDGSDRLGGMTLDQTRQWWSFQPLPDVDRRLTPTDIDQFLLAAAEARGMHPADTADRRTLIRRATYDLTGLPPSPDEVDAFLSDESPEAFETVIDRLLQSPQYGIHWGRHWLDVVRYADTAGENTDRPLPHAWRYRNWVLNAWNQDLPFDEFTRMQICGDLIAADRPAEQFRDGIVATGYLAIARRFGHDIDKDVHLMHEDVIDNLGRNFLGLTLGCARCHDHKFDPVTMADYYALYGIFSSTQFSFPGCEPKGQPRDLIPLLPEAEVRALQSRYEAELAEYTLKSAEADQQQTQLRQLAASATTILAQAAVPEGERIPIRSDGESLALTVDLRQGDVLQLVVSPNGSHGADSTQIDWTLSLVDNPTQHWQSTDLVADFPSDAPLRSNHGAAWCFLDVTEGPEFLRERKSGIEGRSSLNGWSTDDTPSVFVNAADEPVSVWTTLPARSLFVHPGPNREVALAWVCPEHGRYSMQGFVADAHPAGGDGVAFRIEHIAAANYGARLVELGHQASPVLHPRPEPPQMPVAYAVREGEPHNVRLQQRGDPEQPGDEVHRRWLQVFGGAEVTEGDGSGRRALAEWVTDQPLFARVIVNRIWQWHFGRGIAATPNDLGFRGEPPTHPELLDRLAAEFQANGFRMKPLHRLLMQTEAYRRDSAVPAAEFERDPDNRWYARFSRRRLTAEELRDSLLAASRQLEYSIAESHPFPPESSWTFTQHDPFTAIYSTNHRSTFLMVQRQRRHPYLALFDGADPNASTPVRGTTTVPTQALYFLNDPFFHEQSAAFAARVLSESGEDAWVRAAFDRLFQREPTHDEFEIAQRFLDEYPGSVEERCAALARILLASNEFLYVD